MVRVYILRRGGCDLSRCSLLWYNNNMSRNEEILRFVVANQSLEGLVVTDGEKAIVMDCLEGRKTFDSAVKDVVNHYSTRGAN